MVEANEWNLMERPNGDAEMARFSGEGKVIESE